MALVKLRGELPKDAIYLTETEALQHQWELVWDWTPKSEVVPIRFGYVILGLCSSASGFYFNNHYRNKFKLRSFGRMSTYIPIVVLPALLSSFGHQQFVTNDLLLHKTPCSMCVEMRALTLQSALGFFYPLVLGPLAALVNANNYLTYDVPSLTQSPKQVFQLIYKFTKPISTKLSIILALQAIVSSFITYQEAKAVFKVEAKLMQMEKAAEELSE